MKHWGLVVGLLWLGAGRAWGQGAPAEARLDEYFTALTAQQKFNGNVLVTRQGRVLLRKSYNIAGQTDSLRVGPDSKFIIASVSKLFIKYGVLVLARQGKLSLQDPVARFLPDFPRGQDITVSQLLHHQSGLPRELSNYRQYDTLSLARTVELARQETLLFEPGTRTHYSNVGFFLLHRILDLASGEGYARFVQRQVLRPHRMKNTGEFRPGQELKHFAYGFGRQQGRIRAADASALNRFETGNYYATLGDLQRFAAGLFDGRVLPQEAARQLLNAEGRVVQAGGRPGYRAYFYQQPDTRLTFLLLSNYTEMPFEKVVQDVPAIVDGRPYQLPVALSRQPITVPEAVLQRYTGRFALDADPAQVLEVRVEAGQLWLVDKSGEKTVFRADSETTFFESPDSADGLRFEADPAGRYRLVLLSDGLTLPTKRVE